ncbi:hypothetical protein WG66_007335 [Moniliophthora roreri]|nr:hypothetical protein WG66_007335 [Moniliophthora roreri]
MEDLVTTILNIQASRYVSAAGVVILLYDHLLTFGDEVELIWQAEWKFPKFLFLLIRYIVVISVLVHTYLDSEMSGLTRSVQLPDEFVLAIITIAISNSIVLLHMWNLWDRKIWFILCSLVLFIVTQLANTATVIFGMTKIIPSTYFSHELRLCVISNKSSIQVLWAPGLVFEIFMLIALLWNALARPRAGEDELRDILIRDGLVFFTTKANSPTTVLRLANLILAIAAPLSLIFLVVFFVWCTTTVTVTRFMLNLRRNTVEKEKLRDLASRRGPILELQRLDQECQAGGDRVHR